MKPRPTALNIITNTTLVMEVDQNLFSEVVDQERISEVEVEVDLDPTSDVEIEMLMSFMSFI